MVTAVRRLVIITAVHEPAAPYLADAYKSLCAQELPDGWEWHWVIQEDGTSDAVAPHIPDDPRVTFKQGRPGGPGVARMMALAHADGEYVKVLDADDQLTPGALARDLAVLEGDPTLGWTTSRVLDLLPDGSTFGFDQDPDEGPIERGEVLEHWQAHNYRAQVHPATLFIRHDLLLALGGWMALPASEDTGLLLALNSVARGYFTREVGLLYRKWPGQATSQATHTDAGERDARMAVIEARARALSYSNWRYPVTG
ncbi:glycosyltransferase family 2 protein [Streptomyces huiliensis]|uniref:glycosyltransferase family 2 protein n=1 Tax=Streptomyces huiliensis TaxID=2876027 RepID=UPI001CBE4E77|nr:glycosyltransferase family 2 protein [Streptomyces huiliensis]MBZ4321475.1 glycosyltransferase family 2 protein [Streptomyces huiliensis]